MKTVIIDKPDQELKVKNRQLMIGAQGVPFRLIDLLVVANDTIISSSTLLKLTQEEIAILMVTKNNSHFALTLPYIAKNSELKVQQYKALEQRLNIAKYVVLQKINTHSDHLRRFGIQTDIEVWRQKVDSAETVDDLLGYEGAFSRWYFKHYFGLLPKIFHKGIRSKRPALDPVNAILSYMYSIVYNVLTYRLVLAGFDPAISYLHTPFRSHFALSSDFMEFFRAGINDKVQEWFHDDMFKLDDFYKKNGVFLRYEKRKELWRHIKDYIVSIQPECRHQISMLRTALS